MERVIALLKEKNHCLEKFYWVNEQELINFGDGNFDAVEAFYEARERLLDAIGAIDRGLEEECERAAVQITNIQREDAATLLRSKDELVKSILAQDMQILTYVEKEKSNIIRELRANKHARRAVGAYANAERLRPLDSDDI